MSKLLRAFALQEEPQQAITARLRSAPGESHSWNKELRRKTTISQE